jgi:hypothetical protein
MKHAEPESIGDDPLLLDEEHGLNHGGMQQLTCALTVACI